MPVNFEIDLDKKETYVVFFSQVTKYLDNTNLKDVTDDFLLNLESYLIKIKKHLDNNPHLVKPQVLELIEEANYKIASLGYKMPDKDQRGDPNFFKTIDKLRKDIVQIKDLMIVAVLLQNDHIIVQGNNLISLLNNLP